MEGNKVYTEIIVDVTDRGDFRLQHVSDAFSQEGKVVEFWGGDVVDEGVKKFAYKLRIAGDTTVPELTAAARQAGLVVLENAQEV